MQQSAIDVIASSLGPAPPDLGEFSSPDGALTLLFTDIEDAAAMQERLGKDHWSDLLRDHRTMLERIVEHHDGNIVKSENDGHMIAFSSAHAALHCAIDVQRTFAGQPLASLGGPLPIRSGLHAGYVIVNADDFYGRNVVLAARVADRARGGEILVSDALREYTETDPTFNFELKGEFHFKGMLGEHKVYAVEWADGGGKPRPT
ncbi:MAG: eukaryotic-like serine/threonine-protein kinase [Solirubrobacteraceae bacterium]|nr:eukaryotic-like serine/threonine-protein kinase [Solirubrobacteraceae bacterium]